MSGNPLAFFIVLFVAITAFWAGLGWVLGRYAGRVGILLFAILALGTAGNLIGHPQLLREGIGLLPLLVSMGIGALVCIHLSRRRARLNQAPSRRS